MSDLKVTQNNAWKAYNEADNTGKTMLSNLFGKDVFNQKITDRVKSFEDACAVLGKDPNKVLPYPACTTDVEEQVDNSFKRARIIVEALNEGWRPDWSNSSQPKYYTWWDMSNPSSGVGLSVHGCGCSRSNSVCGSRLSFKTSELAVYAGNQFPDVFAPFMTFQSK